MLGGGGGAGPAFGPAPFLLGGQGAAKVYSLVSWSPRGTSPRPAPSLCGGLTLGRRGLGGGGGGLNTEGGVREDTVLSGFNCKDEKTDLVSPLLPVLHSSVETPHTNTPCIAPRHPPKARLSMDFSSFPSQTFVSFTNYRLAQLFLPAFVRFTSITANDIL